MSVSIFEAVALSLKELCTYVKQTNLQGEVKITDEHVKNNEEMRRVLAKNKIIPENLPAEEDIKKLERRVKKDENIIADTSKHKKKLK